MNNYKVKSNEQIRKELTQLGDQLCKGVDEYFKSDRYRELLGNVAKFHNYSLDNAALIAVQRPDAIYVAGINKWNKDFNRQVIEGEKGIRILAPVPFEKEIPKEELDKYCNLRCEIRQGSSEDSVVISGMNFRPTTVFDISQTKQIEGKPVIELDMAKQLTDNVNDYDKLKKAIEQASPVEIEYEYISGSANGYFSPIGEKIVVKNGMSEAQTIKTLLHEVSHAMLHCGVDKSSKSFYFVKEDGQKASELSLKDTLDMYKKEQLGVVGVVVDTQNNKTFNVDLFKDGQILLKNVNENETIKNNFDIQKAIYDINNSILGDMNIRSIRELQAESTAYMVANKLGIDTSNYSFGYVASWSRASPKMLLKTLNASRACAFELYDKIELNLQKLSLKEAKESLNTFELATKIDNLIRDFNLEMYLEAEDYQGATFSKIHSDLINNKFENINYKLKYIAFKSDKLLKERALSLLDEIQKNVHKTSELEVKIGGIKL